LQIPYSTSLNFGRSLKGKALVLYKFNPDKLFIAQEEGSMLFKWMYMKKKGGRLRRFLTIVDGTSPVASLLFLPVAERSPGRNVQSS